MDFTFPPSEVSVSSGFLSVSAPEPGSEQQSSEEKGQQVLAEAARRDCGLSTAERRFPSRALKRPPPGSKELKELSVVWKGTAEEKGRNKFIESLAKMVEDRHRDLVREMDQAARREEAAPRALRGRSPVARRVAGEEAKVPGGFGLISQLQKLRSGL
ncbi:hypothetical protein J3459_012081 [Metarhizium acridum]|nr:hypothetical protein J3459_012081 [Metarhizium acridum]